MGEVQSETIIQLVFLALAFGIFMSIYNLPKKTLTKLRTNSRASTQANRHFLQGAHLLTRAKSTRNKPTSLSLAKDALSEADKALALQPKDPASHILRALALDLLGHRTSALRSLDVALSPPSVKMLGGKEKGDALVKRAEIQLGLNRKRRVDSAMSDLVEAVGLTRDNAKAFCLLGQCYEIKGVGDEARKAFDQALELDPECASAQEGLGRVGRVKS